jgi:hypothetical protein
MPGHLHHDVADVARAHLPAFQQEEPGLHEENQAAHRQQPQPVDVGFHVSLPEHS